MRSLNTRILFHFFVSPGTFRVLTHGRQSMFVAQMSAVLEMKYFNKGDQTFNRLGSVSGIVQGQLEIDFEEEDISVLS